MLETHLRTLFVMPELSPIAYDVCRVLAVFLTRFFT